MRLTRGYLPVFGLVVAAGAAAATIALTSPAARSSHAARRPTALPVAISSNAAISAPLVSHYSVLRDPATSGPYPLPRPVVNGWLGSPSLGLEPGQARYVEVPGLAAAWLVPGSDGACFVWLSPTGGTGPAASRLMTRSGCDSVSQADSQGLVSVEGTSAGEMLVGLVPDGMSVSITKADGASERVPVADNAFAITATASDRITGYSVGGTAQQAPDPATPPA
jgi:hypothetical protein